MIFWRKKKSTHDFRFLFLYKPNDIISWQPSPILNTSSHVVLQQHKTKFTLNTYNYLAFFLCPLWCSMTSIPQSETKSKTKSNHSLTKKLTIIFCFSRPQHTKSKFNQLIRIAFKSSAIKSHHHHQSNWQYNYLLLSYYKNCCFALNKRRPEN